MADTRGPALCDVVLDCSIEENVRRIASPQRTVLRKLVDPQALPSMRMKANLLDGGGDYRRY